MLLNQLLTLFTVFPLMPFFLSRVQSIPAYDIAFSLYAVLISLFPPKITKKEKKKEKKDRRQF